MAESGVHLNVNKEYLWRGKSLDQLIVRKKMNTNVGVLKLFPGISEVLVETMLNCETLEGLILETYGAGNATTEDWFVDLLKKAISRGLHIINVSQCAGGSVNMGQYETSSKLKTIGVISGKDITTEAAITKLMYLLGENIPHSEFKKTFETSLRGEMT